MTPLAAVLPAVALALAGRAAGWFTGPAAAAGGAIAAAVLLGTGPGGFLILALFVVSGALLTRGPGSRRGMAQVLANGWAAAAGAACSAAGRDWGWAVLAGGLAAAQADTWATEIGRRWGGVPVLLTSRLPVPPGTSGGVSRAGTAAGVLGAAVTGAVVRALGYHTGFALAVALGGAAGMLLDSLLGATVQAAYLCPLCGAPSDLPRHCGVPARQVGGRRRVTNDLVNALATGGGAAVAALLAPVLA